MTAPFDYSRLSAEDAAQAKSSAERINKNARGFAIATGQELLRMEALLEERLGHGHFESWVLAELPFSLATARNYKALTRAFADKPLTVSALPLAVLYRLAGAATQVRDAIVTRIEAGEHVTVDEVRSKIGAPKAAAIKTTQVISRSIEPDAPVSEPAQVGEAETAEELLQRQQMATVLVHLLRQKFDYATVVKLNSLWQRCGFDVVEKAIAAVRPASDA